MEKKLNKFLADLSVLAKKTQNYHWNITGSGFFSAHKQLDIMYEDLNDFVDEIAERLLALGYTPLSSFKTYLENASIEEAKNEAISIKDALNVLLKDYEYIVNLAKDVKNTADDENDYGTSAMMDEFILKQEKLMWMIRANLK